MDNQEPEVKARTLLDVAEELSKAHGVLPITEEATAALRDCHYQISYLLQVVERIKILECSQRVDKLKLLSALTGANEIRNHAVSDAAAQVGRGAVESMMMKHNDTPQYEEFIMRLFVLDNGPPPMPEGNADAMAAVQRLLGPAPPPPSANDTGGEVNGAG